MEEEYGRKFRAFGFICTHIHTGAYPGVCLGYQNTLFDWNLFNLLGVFEKNYQNLGNFLSTPLLTYIHTYTIHSFTHKGNTENGKSQNVCGTNFTFLLWKIR